MIHAVRRIALIIVGIIVCTFGFSSSAQAQENACQAMSIDDMRAGLDQIEAALRRTAQVKAMRAANMMYERMPCLTSVATPEDLSAFGRLRCEIAFWDQDEDLAMQWCAFSRAIANLPWPSRIDETHPLRNLMGDLEQPELAGPDDKGLAPPKGGVFLLDGRPAFKAKAMVEVPHFVQLLDKKGQLTLSTWIDGAAFPPDLIGEPITATPKMPKDYAPPAPAPLWDAEQKTLTPEEEKQIVEDRSNDPETSETEKEEYVPDVPVFHEKYEYIAPPESAYGRLRVTVVNHKQKAVKAPIMVDGTDMGKTPWEGELPAGAHFIEVMGQVRDIVIQNGMLTETMVVIPASTGKEKPVKEPKEKPVKEPKEKPVKEPKEKPVQEPKEKPVKEPKEKPVKEPKEKPVKEPKEKPVKEPKEKPVKEPKEKPKKEPKEKIAKKEKRGSKIAIPMLIAGGGTTVVGLGGVTLSFAQAQGLKWNASSSQVNSLQLLNGISWGLTGVGLGLTGFGVIKLSTGGSVGVTAGPKTLLLYGRW